MSMSPAFSKIPNLLATTNFTLAFVTITPLLTSILSKAQQAVTTDELLALRKEWIAKDEPNTRDWIIIIAWIAGSAAIFSLISLSAVRRNRRFAREIAERKAFQADIEKHRSNLVEVMESTQDGIWSIDQNYHTTSQIQPLKKSIKRHEPSDIVIGESIFHNVDPVIEHLENMV